MKATEIRYKEIEGDLIELALEGEFDVIAHGCNCFCNMGSGIAPLMAENFHVNKYEWERPFYKGDMKKLGNIQFEPFRLLSKGNNRIIFPVNAYTQYKYGKNHADGVKNPLDYEALRLCMKKINHEFKDLHIGLPRIGAGLAGGDWNVIQAIIQEELKNCQVTIVRLPDAKLSNTKVAKKKDL